MLERQVHRGDQLVEVFFQVLAAGGGLSPFPEHGQDGTLHGLGNGVIGFLDTGQHGAGEGFHIGLPDTFEAFGDTGVDAGEDDARVAPGPHQHSGGHGLRHFGERTPRGVAAGLDGHEHVVSRVPVGDGKYVEVVDGLAVGGQCGGAAADEVQVKVCVNSVHLMRGCSSGTSPTSGVSGR